jgi:hypothetical protein
VLTAHQQLADEQRLLALVGLREQCLDSSMLDLVLTEDGGGVLEAQEKVGELLRRVPDARMQVDHLPEKRQGGLLITQLLGQLKRSEHPGIGVVEFACKSLVSGHSGELGDITCSARVGVCDWPGDAGSSEQCVHPSPFVRGEQRLQRLGLARVMEPVPPIGGYLERARVDRLAEEPGNVPGWRAREVDSPIERRSGSHLSADGNREHQLARRAGEPLPRAEHRAAEVRWQTRRKRPRVRREALDEQPVEVGVAAGACLHFGHERFVR